MLSSGRVRDVIGSLRSPLVFNRALTITKAPDLFPKRLVLRYPRPPYRYSARFGGHAASCLFGSVVWVLRRCGEVKLSFRNSYRCLKYHIYETVKLDQIELSNQSNHSESEKTYKAFIEHDLV